MDTSDAKWAKVYYWLLAFVDEHKFSENKKLPSENALSRRMKISRDTIRYAMKKLEEEGLVYRIQGSGTYINKDVALSRELDSGTAQMKVGLILQGQDRSANSEFLRGVRQVIPEDRIDLRIFLTDNKFTNERQCLQTVVRQNFQGFIVDGVKASILNPNEDCYREIYRRRIPLIFYNNYYRNLNSPRVVVDDAKCAEFLVDRLLQAGHRHIAGIFVYDNYQGVEKFQGMYATMHKNGVILRDSYIKWCISDEAHDESFAKSIVKFLKSIPKCTAVVCCNYMIYRLVRRVLAQMGKRVPEEYSVVCLDYSADDWEKEAVTCSVHQGFLIGYHAAESLLKMIRRKDCDDNGYSVALPPKIYEGSSIRNMLSPAK